MAFGLSHDKGAWTEMGFISPSGSTFPEEVLAIPGEAVVEVQRGYYERPEPVWVACEEPERSPEEGNIIFHLECIKCNVLAEVAFRNGFISERMRNFIVPYRVSVGQNGALRRQEQADDV